MTHASIFFDVLYVGCCSSFVDVTNKFCRFWMTASFRLDLGVCRRALSGYSESRTRLGGESMPCHEGRSSKEKIDRWDDITGIHVIISSAYEKRRRIIG